VAGGDHRFASEFRVSVSSCQLVSARCERNHSNRPFLLISFAFRFRFGFRVASRFLLVASESIPIAGFCRAAFIRMSMPKRRCSATFMVVLLMALDWLPTAPPGRSWKGDVHHVLIGWQLEIETPYGRQQATIGKMIPAMC
jgi:hypothetical protein